MTTVTPQLRSQLGPRTAEATLTDDEVQILAAEIGRVAAAHDTAHDRDASFVTEAYAEMADQGYLRLAVPAVLGGLGATLAQVMLAQEELASHSGSAALAAAMHLYLTLVQHWRLRHGATDAEPLLRRIASDGLIMATSGGSDWVCPTTTATEVDGGYRLDGRKTFCTQAPVAGVVATSAVLGRPGPDAVVLHTGIPMTTPGLSIVETWDTLGMRGTASHDLVFDAVFVPAEKITGTRPYGVLAGPLLVAVVHFAPVIAAVYLGIARGACAEATRLATPDSTRQVGQMHARLRIARWALHAAVAELGGQLGELSADEDTLVALMTAKRHAVIEARAIVDIALEVAHGPAFFRGSPLERAYRDVRGGPFHPIPPEETLELAGRHALAARDTK